jgi:hypothetical protein
MTTPPTTAQRQPAAGRRGESISSLVLLFTAFIAGSCFSSLVSPLTVQVS